ncbi:MAG: hypothetical protein ABI414_13265 [Devosia sp.]
MLIVVSVIQVLLAAAIDQLKSKIRTTLPGSGAWDGEVGDQPPAVMTKTVWHLGGSIWQGRVGIAHGQTMEVPIAGFVQVGSTN